MTSSIVNRKTIFLGLAVAVTVAALLQVHFDFEHDDAYISYRYADNWANGRGLVFNQDERVEGYSNFLWVTILSLCRRLGLGIVPCARLLGALSGLALVLVVFDFVSRRLERGPGLGLIAAAALALHTAVAVWAPSGLETVPLALAVLAAQGFLVGRGGGGSSVARSGSPPCSSGSRPCCGSMAFSSFLRPSAFSQ